MKIDNKLDILKKLYALHDDFISGPDLACRKGCAECCTANVTMTTLEGLLVIDHWRRNGEDVPTEGLKSASLMKRFEPALTINRLAALCLREEQVPEDYADPDVGACPLLKENRCSIYAVRPFGCRAMVSKNNCSQTGAADMPDQVLSANNLFLQFIEAIDIPGASGNLVDILLLLTDAAFREAYEGGQCDSPPGKLLVNQAMPVIMIDPAHRKVMEPLLDRIRRIVQERNE